VPAEYGGLGMQLLDAALIAAECGRVCLAEPLVDTAFVAVAWLLSKGETGDLAAIAAGEKTVPLAHNINGWVAGGDSDANSTGRIESVDPLRNLSPLPADASDDPHLLNLGALMSAAQLIGIAEAMLDQTVEYTKMRQQFGQPIGAFQAVKHQLASAAVALEFARPTVWRAAQALDDLIGDDALGSSFLHVSHAKLAAGDAATQMAETAIQMHGAMGYTYEVDLHFWMKRSWALAGAWGSRAFHLKRIDEAVIGGTQPIGPEHTFA